MSVISFDFFKTFCSVIFSRELMHDFRYFGISVKSNN